MDMTKTEYARRGWVACQLDSIAVVSAAWTPQDEADSLLARAVARTESAPAWVTAADVVRVLRAIEHTRQRRAAAAGR